MKKLLILSLLILNGCCTPVPVKMDFPEAPKDLLEECPDLSQIDPKKKELNDVLDSVTDNYMQYYDCKLKTEVWIEWYNNQKKIYDKVK
jgi:hypothetical protein